MYFTVYTWPGVPSVALPCAFSGTRGDGKGWTAPPMVGYRLLSSMLKKRDLLQGKHKVQ
jgi:hypothetical protein